MPQSTEKTIAVAFDLNFGQATEVFRGVSEHCAEDGAHWRLLPLSYGFEASLTELAGRGVVDGVIGTFVSDRWLDDFRASGLPAVNVFNFARIGSVPSVAVDDLAIGREAARHLREQGAVRVGFLGEGRLFQSRLRREGFSGVAGMPEPVPELENVPALGGDLTRLAAGSGPGGLFCANDRLARLAVVEAGKLGLRVGRDLLVVGVGNDPAESVHAGIGLSSFELPVRAIGRRAARLLEALLAGEIIPAGPHQVGRPELVARESSLVGGRARLAERALADLRERFGDPELTVEEMARTAGASRRSLESALREQTGRSPYQLLCARRLEHAKELLTRTDAPVGRIGERCGFSGHHHFSAWFRKQTGMPPREFRKRAGRWETEESGAVGRSRLSGQRPSRNSGREPE